MLVTVTSITLPLQAASNGRNYMHYMAHDMLLKMLMLAKPCTDRGMALCTCQRHPYPMLCDRHVPDMFVYLTMCVDMSVPNWKITNMS